MIAPPQPAPVAVPVPASDAITVYCPAPAAIRSPLCWPLALAGQFVLVFAVVTLSAPGRIDIVDGQTRYEVARSLVDHGDSKIRDEKTWFAVYNGRDGDLYTDYRFPQSSLGVLLIWAADATGPVCELRRQFFYALMSPLACALLALAYSVWFRALGYRPRVSLFWATAGIFCTPNWFYGTSTFDDILGTATVVLAVVVMWLGSARRPLLAAVVTGLLFGWAYNCKPPLVFFALPALVAGWRGAWPGRRQFAQAAVVAGGVLLGMVAMKLYHAHKFPDYVLDPMEEYESLYGPYFTSNPLPGLVSLIFSPSAGALWYCPTLLLVVHGLVAWRGRYRAFTVAALAACLAFFGFVSCLSFFKGEPCWGPRYLTPLFALLWVWAPAALERVGRGLVVSVLGLGLLMQLLGLSMDPHRLFLEVPLHWNYYVRYPWLSFAPTTSHLLYRPGEIVDVLTSGRRSPEFGPGPLATHVGGFETERRVVPMSLATLLGTLAMPVGPAPVVAVSSMRMSTVPQNMEAMQAACGRYHIFNAFRPWWASQGYLAPADRPVDLERTLVLLLALIGGGLGLMLIGGRLPRGERA